MLENKVKQFIQFLVVRKQISYDCYQELLKSNIDKEIIDFTEGAMETLAQEEYETFRELNEFGGLEYGW